MHSRGRLTVALGGGGGTMSNGYWPLVLLNIFLYSLHKDPIDYVFTGL